LGDFTVSPNPLTLICVLFGTKWAPTRKPRARAPESERHPAMRKHYPDLTAVELIFRAASADETPEMFSTAELAKWLGVSEKSVAIARRRRPPRGPKCVRLPRGKVGYRRADLLKWLVTQLCWSDLVWLSKQFRIEEAARELRKKDQPEGQNVARSRG
jgi:hypothetical protein